LEQISQQLMAKKAPPSRETTGYNAKKDDRYYRLMQIFSVKKTLPAGKNSGNQQIFLTP
jgi:hypothetical protein